MLLKDKLTWLLVHGSSEQIDAVLGMEEADSLQDLLTTLDAMPTDSLARVRWAIEQRRLEPHSYYGSHSGKGCLLYFLTGVRSNQQLYECFPDQSLLASASRTIRWFDRGKYSDRTLLRVLTKLLRDRREANRAEDEAVRRLSAARRVVV